MTAKEKKKNTGGMYIDLGLNSLFKGIDNLLSLVYSMLEEGKEEIMRTGEFKSLGRRIKGIYGFTIRVGLGGLPQVEPFGNLRETIRGVVVEEVREPIVDVFDEEDKVLVIAELPGVEESEIELAVQDDILTIKASGTVREYAKEVLLPCLADTEAMSWSYKSGILEVMLPKIRKWV